MDPGAIPAGTSGYTASNYEGANVTLGLFAEVYPDFTLTSTSIQLPGGKLYKNGDKCTGTGVKTTGVGKLQAWVWSSPKAKGHLLTTDLTKYHPDQRSDDHGCVRPRRHQDPGTAIEVGAGVGTRLGQLSRGSR